MAFFKKLVFGSKKETHQTIENPEQSQLEFTEKVDLDLPQDIAQQKAVYHRKVKNTKRTDYTKLNIPAHLERVITIIEPLDKTEYGKDWRRGNRTISYYATKILCQKKYSPKLCTR